MNHCSVVRAVFAALLLAVATGADAQGFGSVSSGARLPAETEPAVAVPTVEAPTTIEPATNVPESAATPPFGATAAAAGVTEPFGTTEGLPSAAAFVPRFWESCGRPYGGVGDPRRTSFSAHLAESPNLSS